MGIPMLPVVRIIQRYHMVTSKNETRGTPYFHLIIQPNIDHGEWLNPADEDDDSIPELESIGGGDECDQASAQNPVEDDDSLPELVSVNGDGELEYELVD